MKFFLRYTFGKPVKGSGICKISRKQRYWGGYGDYGRFEIVYAEYNGEDYEFLEQPGAKVFEVSHGSDQQITICHNTMRPFNLKQIKLDKL